MKLSALLIFVAASCAGPGGSPIGSSNQEISACKKSCDKMKFFECNSAAEMAACYSGCDSARSDDIELFVACADNSVCDPQCRIHIEPASPGPVKTQSACGSACDKLVSCSVIRLGDKDACVAACEQYAFQSGVDCVLQTSCDQVVATCGVKLDGSGGSSGGGGTTGGGGGTDAGVVSCQSACDSLSFFGCLSAADHAACRDLCATAAADRRDSFTTCANANAVDCTRGDDCYTVFSN
jgi:hypothetical protein